MHGRVADEPALAHFVAPGLELRLDQDDQIGARRASSGTSAGSICRTEMNDTSIVDELERARVAGQLVGGQVRAR